MRRLWRFAVLFLLGTVLTGCVVQKDEVTGRWEGFTEGGYRFVLNLDDDGTGSMSKLGGPAGYSDQPITWNVQQDRVVVESQTGYRTVWFFAQDELRNVASGFEVQRGGPFAGYRYPVLTGVIALIVTMLLTPYVRKFAIQKGAIDDPKADNRRVHTEPIPRWGGLAIYGGIVVALFAVLFFAYPGPRPFPPYLIGLLVLGALVVVNGAFDDIRQFKPAYQMVFLLLVGVAIQAFYSGSDRVQMAGMTAPFSGSPGVWIPFGWAAVPITAIYIFVVTKTMDTIDGIDGLASGIAAIAGATLSIIAVYEGQPRVAIIAAAIGGSALGFLRHNYNPAKIFMGTGGAQLLGFLLACLSIVGAFKTAAAVALVVPILVFGVPLFDAAFVVVRRLMGGKPISQADKSHVHHTLLEQGLSQRQTVWILYMVAAVLCGLLLVAVRFYG